MHKMFADNVHDDTGKCGSCEAVYYAAEVDAHVGSLERDAARYRWIRERSHADIAGCWLVPSSVEIGEGEEGFDAAIDLAMTCSR